LNDAVPPSKPRTDGFIFPSFHDFASRPGPGVSVFVILAEVGGVPKRWVRHGGNDPVGSGNQFRRF